MNIFKKHNKLFLENWNNYSNLILCEGVEELQKYFPKMSLETLKKIIALDPTYKGGDELGKYGKWIIKLVYNNIKNSENIKSYKELLKQYPDGINPKNGQPFQKPIMLPAILDEDIYKIPESLKKYELYKKEIKQPIDAFKTLPELDKAISEVEKSGVPTNELALKRYNLFQEAMKKGLKKVYEDEDWIVGIPTTLQSSVMFGNDTSWCTTSPNGNMYYGYKNKYGGDYYINLNKQDGDLYQFHFESEQFMNSSDYFIGRDYDGGIEEFWDTYPKLTNFYKNIVESNLQPKDESYYENKVNEILKDDKSIQSWFDNDLTKNIKIENGNVSGLMPLDYIKNVYDENAYRDGTVSLKFIQAAIDGDLWDYFDYNYSDYRFSDLYHVHSDWKKLIEPLNISWDDIEIIWDNDGNFDEESIKELDSDMTPEQANQIWNLLYDDFNGEGISIISAYAQAYQSGSEAEAMNTITESLKDNLPLHEKYPFDDGYLHISFSKEDIIDVLKYQGDDNKDNGDWWLRLSKVNDYDEEYSWLQKWRDIHFDEIEFSISAPYYGWNDFDDKYWSDGLEYFAENVKKIMNK